MRNCRLTNLIKIHRFQVVVHGVLDEALQRRTVPWYREAPRARGLFQRAHRRTAQEREGREGETKGTGE